MVAVIKTGHSIHRIVNYNEQKVKLGVAACIGASNFPIDADKMSISTKLNLFLRQLSLNENVSRNSVHISLNFHPSENHLDNEKLDEIAREYMDKIGFGKQPFLVYRHFDAGHPHIHVVSIKVRSDGTRIDMNNIGRNQSEAARKSLEKAYSLVPAEMQQKADYYQLKPVSASKVMYGKAETKMAIQKVMEHVLPHYKYTSLQELNAVLAQYNVSAEAGLESSRVRKHNGLIYRVLDEGGKPVGVPIKASLFYNKPTLRFLEGKFSQNEAARHPYKSRVKNAVDLALLPGTTTLERLKEALAKQGIYVVTRENAQGYIYGLTYVDHQTKCVFNGSDLGKPYSAKGVIDRCLKPESQLPVTVPLTAVNKPAKFEAESERETLSPQLKDEHAKEAGNGSGDSILDMLIQPEHTLDYIPGQLKNKGRKKKKGRNISKN